MIHRYIQGGLFIVLDINSGAVHVMDEPAYQMAGLLHPPLGEDCPKEVETALSDVLAPSVIEETYRELLALYRAGELFSEDDYGCIEKLTAVSPIKAMCLHVAHDCNMRCEYCFASSGEYHGGRALMSIEVAKKAIDYLLLHSKDRQNLELDFFGGEPLMNLDVIRETVRYAREKEKTYGKVFRFTTTTNGLLLNDETIDFLNREMSNIVLSLDGRPSVNDRMRKRVDGSSAFANILPKFQKVARLRGDKPYYVRGTFTKYNLDFVEDVLYLHEQGFTQISVEPVVADQSMPYALTEADFPVIFREYERLADILIQREQGQDWFNFFHFMMDLDQGPCAIKRLRGCGCGNEYVAVTPQGDVYPCHQFVGYPDWRMGSVLDGSMDGELKRTFAASTVYGKEDCRGCWAKFYCSGGCNANAMIYNGDILKPHQMSCELEKKRVECALYIKAALSVGPSVKGEILE